MWLAVLVACAFLFGACGGSDKPTGKSGGDKADAKLADELGATDGRGEIPLRLCDRRSVEVVRVSGEEAIDTWRELRSESSDRWPVLVGSPDDAALLAEMTGINCKDGYTYERTLQQAEKVDVEHAIARVARGYGVRARELRGSTPLPDEPPSNDFVVPFDLLSGDPLPEIRIALLPIDEGWKAPAILPWGHYNDNPAPPVHTAVLRDWNRRYGAELVSMTGDTLELSVERPPTSDQAALALAREQFSYAPDIVQQGTDDVDTLAAILKNARAWYFWWD